jgi:hypothetical protein
VGLTLDEGQQRLRRVQMEIITAQARDYELCGMRGGTQVPA